jgi:L-ascorbate metabolism protein UlaG (beta-lactamase superfamily)
MKCNVKKSRISLGGGKKMLQIRWHGHACFEITNQQTIITDPHDGKSIGIPTPMVHGDIILISHDHYDHNSVKTVEKEQSKIITEPRKRTIDDITIKGFGTYHDEHEGAKRGENIMYHCTIDGISFLHTGDLGHVLDDKLIDAIGPIDILFIPIGGTYTLDAEAALNVISKLKPKITIPMHYKIEGLSLPIASLDEFLDIASFPLIKVGNEIDIEKEELPAEPEIWVFTL